MNFDLTSLPRFLAGLDWSSVIATVSSLVLAVLTFIYVRLTKKILDAQSDPCVVVSAQHDSDRPTIIQLVIRNVGAGLARDITFSLSRPIPARAWGLSEETTEPAEEMVHGPLIDGLPALGPGEERRIDWGQFGGLKNSLGDEPILITSRFRKGNRAVPPVVSAVDIKSFSGTTAAKSVHAKIANDIEKIARDLQHLSSGFRQLRVVVTRCDDRRVQGGGDKV